VLERILVSFRDERSADETFGAWIDRQEPGRLELLVGGPIEPLLAPETPPYRHRTPRRTLVGPAWLEAHLSDPTVRVVEVSRDPALFPASRITGAIAIDAESLDAAHDGRDLLAALGATPDDLIVLYGDRENRDAALAYRLLHEAGHTALRLLAGGRRRWIGEGRPVEAGDAPLPLVIEASEAAPTADEAPSDGVVLDVAEAEADATVADAVRLPWDLAVREDGALRGLLDLRRLFEEAGVRPERHVAIAAPTRQEAAVVWFVLREVLGYPSVDDAVGVACTTEAAR